MILAVDIGSSSVRAMICDRAANDAGGTFTQIPYQFDRTPDGGATLDPERVCALVFACIDQTLTKAGRDVHITQVAFDTFATSLMGIDARGKPSTPLYTWSDARGGDLIPALKSRLSPEDYFQRTGCHVHPSYWPLRLLWLRDAEPAAFAKTRRWLSLGAYVVGRIFGQHAISISDAAWTGLLNRHTFTWDNRNPKFT